MNAHVRLPGLILAACIALPAGAQSPQGVAAAPDFATSCSRLGEKGSAALRWYRGAAEVRALFLQAFRLAGERLEALARGKAPGTWAVIADADETLLDTSEFQCELEISRAGKFDPALWDRWVAMERSIATAGAADFVRLVRRLGGLVVVVSNRVEPQHRAATLGNLKALDMAPDALLLAPDYATRDKNSRFKAVATQGIAGRAAPPEILMYLGDAIGDFPGLTQSNPGMPGDFGAAFIIVPNPIYGSWLGNPLR